MTHKAKSVALTLVAAVVGIATALCSYQLSEHHNIRTFERHWTQRLTTMHYPREVEALYQRYGAGDYFYKNFTNGQWLAGVSASSCGNGRLSDMLLMRDTTGRLYKVTHAHFCGRGGIIMAIPDVTDERFDIAVKALDSAENNRTDPQY